MGGFRGKAKGKKAKKTKKTKRDREWAFEGAQFGGAGPADGLVEGGAVNGVGGGAGDEEAPPAKKRRFTQAMQEKQRRMKLRHAKREKQRLKDDKFDRRRREEEERAALDVPVKKTRRSRKRRADATPPPANAVRYRWLHGVRGQQAAAEGDQGVGEGDGGAGATSNGNSNYAKLLAALSSNRSSKYRELLEQRKREQEGLTDSDDDEEEEDEDEDEDDESGDDGDNEEQEDVSGAEAHMNGFDDRAQEEEEEDENEEEGGEEGSGDEALVNGEGNLRLDDGEEEEDAEDLLVDEDEDDDEEEEAARAAGDNFARHFERPALEEGEGVGAGAKLQQLETWTAADVGEAEGADPVEVLVSAGVEALPPRGPLQCPTLKKALRETWEAANGCAATPLQSRLFPMLDAYRDVLMSTLTWDKVGEAHRMVLLHVLNHMLKARARVLKHNRRRRKEAREARARKLAKGVERELGVLDNGEEGDRAGSKRLPDEDKDRDQGFTRPRVLILLPMRWMALKVVKDMIALLGPKTAVSGKDRLEERFGVPADEEEDEKEKQGRSRKPEDWQLLFDGNCDDDFRMGIALTPGQGKGKGKGKGVAVKLFSDFYHSDVVVASPLGLRLAVEASKDHDFLSSVEILVVDQADVLLMQNWDHVADVLRLINQAPKSDHNTDFSRVRAWALEGQAGRFRQTLMLSRFLDPLISAAFAKASQSYEGRVRLRRLPGPGSICEVALRVKQVFHRVHCSYARGQGDARFEYLTKQVLPEVRRLQQGHTLVFVPSYYDFVRLRNHAVREQLSHCCLSEYERVSEASRSRARFFHGQRDLMLYTGRAHFFKRYRVRGARHLVFYGLPEHPQFYPELVNLLEEAESGAEVTSCLVLFTRFEALALERVVGADRARHMLRSDKATFLFC